MSSKNQRRNELEKLTAKQLIKGPATDLNISGRWDMKKSDLVDAILKAEASAQMHSSNAPDNVEESKTENRKTASAVVMNKDAMLRKVEGYIKTIESGMQVAFNVAGGKVKCAEVLHRSNKNGKLKVKTYHGKIYVIKYEDVIWVKTGRRWPRWVYNLLEGITDNEKG